MPVPIKINPERVSHASSDVDLRILNSFIMILNDIKSRSPALAKAVDDGLKIVNCLLFIKCNESFIRYAFTRRKNDEAIGIFLPDDRANAVIRDFNNTSFSLNGYNDEDSCIAGLNSMVQQFESAIQIAREIQQLGQFVESMKYDKTPDSLEHRIKNALNYGKILNILDKQILDKDLLRNFQVYQVNFKYDEDKQSNSECMLIDGDSTIFRKNLRETLLEADGLKRTRRYSDKLLVCLFKEALSVIVMVDSSYQLKGLRLKYLMKTMVNIDFSLLITQSVGESSPREYTLQNQYNDVMYASFTKNPLLLDFKVFFGETDFKNTTITQLLMKDLALESLKRGEIIADRNWLLHDIFLGVLMDEYQYGELKKSIILGDIIKQDAFDFSMFHFILSKRDNPFSQRFLERFSKYKPDLTITEKILAYVQEVLIYADNQRILDELLYKLRLFQINNDSKFYTNNKLKQNEALSLTILKIVGPHIFSPQDIQNLEAGLTKNLARQSNLITYDTGLLHNTCLYVLTEGSSLEVLERDSVLIKIIVHDDFVLDPLRNDAYFTSREIFKENLDKYQPNLTTDKKEIAYIQEVITYAEKFQSLPELLVRWGISEDEIQHFYEEGKLKSSEKLLFIIIQKWGNQIFNSKDGASTNINGCVLFKNNPEWSYKKDDKGCAIGLNSDECWVAEYNDPARAFEEAFYSYFDTNTKKNRLMLAVISGADLNQMLIKENKSIMRIFVETGANISDDLLDKCTTKTLNAIVFSLISAPDRTDEQNDLLTRIILHNNFYLADFDKFIFPESVHDIKCLMQLIIYLNSGIPTTQDDFQNNNDGSNVTVFDRLGDMFSGFTGDIHKLVWSFIQNNQEEQIKEIIQAFDDCSLHSFMRQFFHQEENRVIPINLLMVFCEALNTRTRSLPHDSLIDIYTAIFMYAVRVLPDPDDTAKVLLKLPILRSWEMHEAVLFLLSQPTISIQALKGIIAHSSFKIGDISLGMLNDEQRAKHFCCSMGVQNVTSEAICAYVNTIFKLKENQLPTNDTKLDVDSYIYMLSETETVLHHAVKCSDVTLIRSLLNVNFSITAQSLPTKKTPLCLIDNDSPLSLDILSDMLTFGRDREAVLPEIIKDCLRNHPNLWLSLLKQSEWDTVVSLLRKLNNFSELSMLTVIQIAYYAMIQQPQHGALYEKFLEIVASQRLNLKSINSIVLALYLPGANFYTLQYSLFILLSEKKYYVQGIFCTLLSKLDNLDCLVHWIIDPIGDNGDNLLHKVIACTFMNAACKQIIIQRLYQKGSDLFQINRKKQTPWNMMRDIDDNELKNFQRELFSKSDFQKLLKNLTPQNYETRLPIIREVIIDILSVREDNVIKNEIECLTDRALNYLQRAYASTNDKRDGIQATYSFLMNIVFSTDDFSVETLEKEKNDYIEGQGNYRDYPPSRWFSETSRSSAFQQQSVSFFQPVMNSEQDSRLPIIELKAMPSRKGS